jgi:hypothetical protein
MSDLLKEAIADAKAVRETALANAKMALQEAFTPQLQSMLSAKLREDDDELEDEVPDEEELMAQDEFPGEEEEVPIEQDEFPDEEIPAEEVPLEQDVVPDEEEELMAQDEFPDEEIPDEDDIIEINGVKYAPVIAEDDEELPDEVPGDEEELDLEAIIRELENEINEEEDEDEEEEMTEQDDAYDQNVENKKNSELHEQDDDDDEEVEVDESLFKEEDDEDELEEQDDAYDQNVENKKNSELHEELKEYKTAVRFLRDKLHEVNILNAKLLFTNKIFKEFALTNNQKMKVVETFDRTQTTREIKLVYSTLAESFGDGIGVTRRVKIKESASKKSGSTKPSRKVITEESQVANRFKKLAGLIK